MRTALGLLMAASAALAGCASTPGSGPVHAHVYIVHGYGASTSDHWFAWLKREIEQRGATASVVELPSPGDPLPEAWQQALEQQVGVLDGNTYFVAHSLGSIAVLRFLETTGADKTIGGFVLVSGFNDSLPILPQLDRFRKPDIEYAKLVRLAGRRSVIAAVDDSIVPYALSEKLAASLQVRFVPVARGGHFLASDGFTEFPLVLDELEKVLGSND